MSLKSVRSCIGVEQKKERPTKKVARGEVPHARCPEPLYAPAALQTRPGTGLSGLSQASLWGYIRRYRHLYRGLSEPLSREIETHFGVQSQPLSPPLSPGSRRVRPAARDPSFSSLPWPWRRMPLDEGASEKEIAAALKPARENARKREMLADLLPRSTALNAAGSSAALLSRRAWHDDSRRRRRTRRPRRA